jgi:hypothetical protein
MVAQAKNPRRVSGVASLGVVLFCLLAGEGFVWWYLKEPGDSGVIKLEAKDLDGVSNVAGEPSEEAVRRQIIAQKYFHYIYGNQPASPPRVMELRFDGTIVSTVVHNDELHWRVKGRNLLVSGEAGEVEFFLCSDGSYRGLWPISGAGAVLTPPR